METEALAQELIAHINEILAGSSNAPELTLSESDIGSIESVQYETEEKKEIATQTAPGYWCHLCDNKTYIAKCSLKRHLDTVHSQVRYACLHCNATYARRSDLKKHGIRLHKK